MKALDLAAVAAIVTSWLAFLVLHQNPLGFSLFAAVVVCVLLRGRFNISRTQWLVWILICLAVAFSLLKPQTNRAQATGLIYPPMLPVVVTLGLAILPALLRRHNRREYWASLVLSALFFMLCGINLEPLTREFATLSALWSIFFAFSAKRFLTGRPPSWAALVTLVPALVLLGGIAFAYSFSEHQANMLLRFFSMGGDVSLSFPALNRLNTMLSSESNPAVVARCFSARPETYLPARVYTNYTDGTWSEAGASAVIAGESVGTRFRYPLATTQKTPTLHDRYEVNASPIVLFSPRDTLWLETQSSELALLSGHLLELRGGGTEAYRYTVSRRPGSNLAPPESPEYLEKCLQVSKQDPIVAETARRVMDGMPGSTLAKAKLLEFWLQKEFQYGFGHPFGESPDPIAEFLTKKPPAHCEIFAASLVLMLRTQGIPSRYVNGFVCVEKSFSGDYWVVRVRDAHAWAEVWDGKQWHTLDPTPPSALQPPKDWTGWFDSVREAFFYKLRQLGGLNWKEWVAQIWQRRKYLGLVLIAVAFWKLRGLRFFRAAAHSKNLAVSQHLWIQQLSKALRPRGLQREDCETVLSWGQRLEARLPQLGLEIATWLRDYSAYCYGGAEVGDLGERCQSLLKSLQSLPVEPA